MLAARDSWDCNKPEMSMEASKPRKPKGFKAFDDLARKLVQVPKSELPERKPKFRRRKK
jgi:hypothetical protein